MPDIVTSVHVIPIHLNDERWSHITEEHNEPAGMQFEVLETMAQPKRVIAGKTGEKLAVREVEVGKFW